LNIDPKNAIRCLFYHIFSKEKTHLAGAFFPRERDYARFFAAFLFLAAGFRFATFFAFFFAAILF
jgi:hypothetical protein